MDDTPKTEIVEFLDVEAIKEMIPHRDPFLMIDEVRDLAPDDRVTGINNVTGDGAFFEGHFPGHPIMPGVLIIEAMAQTSAVLVIGTLGKQPGSVVYFMSVDKARFRKPVTPGDTLSILVTKVQNRGPVWKFNGEARVGDTLMAEATFAAMIVDNE